MTEIIIFKVESGQIDVRLATDSIWLTKAQLSQIFRRDRSVIGRHLAAILRDGELEAALQLVRRTLAQTALAPDAGHGLNIMAGAET